MQNQREPNRQVLVSIALMAITTLLGMQLLRSLLPYFTFLLRDRFGWSTPLAGFLALLIFAAAFLANPLRKFLGAMPLFIITVVAVGFSRLALQLWRLDPIGDFIFATTGVISFFLFLPISLGLARRMAGSASLFFGLGILVGMGADLAVNGAFLSYDLSWQHGWLPTLITLLLIGVQFVLIAQLLRLDLPDDTSDALFNLAISWLIIGPYLFLQLLSFSNIAWVASNSGLTFSASFFLLLLVHILGIATLLLPARLFHLVVSTATGVTLLIDIGILLIGSQVSWLAIIYIVLGQIALSGLLLSITMGLGRGRRLGGLRHISLANGLGMLLLILLLFSYYAVYDLNLPFSNSILPIFALLIIFMLALPLLQEQEQRTMPNASVVLRVVIFMLLLLAVPILQRLIWQNPGQIQRNGQPIRVVNYNLHNGIDPQGHLGLEALARVIEAENPDVVGLQEVSRGWVINGSVDMLTWLSQRLGMTAVFGPTADSQWGNAVLTRLPILSQENRELPTDELLLRRGYLVVQMDRGSDEPLEFINTHYHHKDGEGDIRLDQSLAVLGFWDERPNTVIVGDLNAEHGEPEIDIYKQAGFGDVLDLTGVFPGYTNPVPSPTRRIDYIWITPDLQAKDANIPLVGASDHLATAVSID
ncbi:MAG: endonuclease/exonuclease/phosphatase family protein [Candidatus Promineifilaceae bacterium]|nr:endonuclease/exonuclease/phosphatase family protein [Candidatus Promineifilaceae bacterium]